MPLDDRAPYWAARFRMTPTQADELRRRAEATVRSAYDATTRMMAQAGERLDARRDDAAAALDKFKAGVQAEIDRAPGRPPAKAPATRPVAPPARPAPRPPTKRDAARDFGAGVLLDRIAEGEGTGGANGYDTTFGHGRYDPDGWDKPISQMTLDELDAFQAELAKRSRASSAVGRYQINRKTMDDLRSRMGLTGSELYSPELQDRLGRERLRMAHWEDYVTGKITRDEFQTWLARGWASVALPSGQSRYGQPVGTNIRADPRRHRPGSSRGRTSQGDRRSAGGTGLAMTYSARRSSMSKASSGSTTMK